ncbi:MAG: hypothetical protein PQ612_08990 [Rickettsiales bacterium]|nr:hypothetical protein [Pseudomonadota bacterium]MDG4544108.1 hypothetical protein [Rickettsiales bacterium]MDG4546289.1 hypothetical protein [Rickettsiales bacterium]MDG4548432.1 hypothetical protein [Rickettsiales bacterium]
MGRHYKQREFPKHVIEVKNELEASNDERLEVMKKLTEPRHPDDVLAKDLYIKMWGELSENRLEYNPTRDNRWVYDFLDSVIAASNLPEHAYISNKDRKDLTYKINDATKKLVMLYKNHGFNESIMTNSLLIESYDEEKGRHVIKEHMSINEVLIYYKNKSIDVINTLGNNSKTPRRTKSIRFLRELNDRINFDESCTIEGDTTLYSVLEGAEYAIYGSDEDDGGRFGRSDIRNLFTRKNEIKKYANGISCF